MREAGDGETTAELLRRAALGSQRAWREVVDRNHQVVWGVARACTATFADAEDACQVTWLLLAENLERVRDPAALPGWLVTTARRESIRLSTARRRESPSGVGTEEIGVVGPAHHVDPEHQVLKSMTYSMLWQAFSELPHGCQQLLRVLAVAPETSYAQISEVLGMPHGSIGPKRGRCLVDLRRRMLASGMPEEAAG